MKNPDGTRETYYVVFFTEKKINNNDTSKANMNNAHSRLSNTLIEIDDLLSKIENEQDFDNARHDQLKYIKAMIKALG